MERFFTLLRQGKFKVKYNEEFNPQWTDEEISQHITVLDCYENQLTSLPLLPLCQELDCSRNQLTFLPPLSQCQRLYCFQNQLTSLPSLPLCERLYCFQNQLTSLPPLPRCQELYCSMNQLTTLPPLPQCQLLYCSKNQLTSLPLLPLCQRLYCSRNQLTSLPPLPQCQELVCNDNPLLFISLREWNIIWQFRSLYYGKKYLRLLYCHMLTQKARRKRDLHLELKYSPDLPFYQEDEYVHHFKRTQQGN
jgi:Leucine-rich repeat (LRR) protein